MAGDDSQRDELMYLVGELTRARGALIEHVRELGDVALDSRRAGQFGWTVRRLVEYCRATERWHFTRVFNFFNPEAKVYDSAAASLDHECPETLDRSLARECAEVWLAGRETEMWLDVIQCEDLDAVHRASRGLPRGGWTIRGVFRKVTTVYSENARVLAEAKGQ